MALPVNGSTHLIPARYSFIDPERMKGWVGLVGWPVADGLPTLVVAHQLQVERRTGKVRRPLCHATARVLALCLYVCLFVRHKSELRVNESGYFCQESFFRPTPPCAIRKFWCPPPQKIRELPSGNFPQTRGHDRPIVETCYRLSSTKIDTQNIINWTVVDQLP